MIGLTLFILGTMGFFIFVMVELIINQGWNAFLTITIVFTLEYFLIYYMLDIYFKAMLG